MTKKQEDIGVIIGLIFLGIVLFWFTVKAQQWSDKYHLQKANAQMLEWAREDGLIE